MNQTNGNTQCEQCTYLPGMAADYSQTSFSDTNQLSLLSGMDMPAKSLENAQQMDGFPTCECGKGTLACSIHPSTPEAWTLFMRDSLAKILALPVNKQELARKRAVASTVKSSASLAWFDPSSCSWKTSQQSFLTDSEQSWQTLPRSGMTANGYAFALPTLALNTTETGGFFWATPTRRDHQGHTITKNYPNGFNKNLCTDVELIQRQKMWPTPTVQDSNKATKKWRENFQNNLTAAVFNPQRMFPTPTRRDHKGAYKTGALIRKDGKSRKFDALPNAVLDGMGAETATGQLNPQWVEWLMGFPIGYTDSKDWVTPKSRSKQQRPTVCSEASK